VRLPLDPPTSPQVGRLSSSHRQLAAVQAGQGAARRDASRECCNLGAPLSKSAVSRLVSRLEESYERWRQRELAEEHIGHLYLDAIYPEVRNGGKVVSLPVLVALGVKAPGEKILLALV